MKLLIDIPDKVYNRVAGAPRCANFFDAFEDRDIFVKALQTGTIVNTVQNEINLSGTTNGDIVKAMFPNWEIEQIKNRYDVNVDNFTRFSFYEEWWNAPYEAAEKQSDANLRFEWDYEDANIGRYTCNLYDGDEKINDIGFVDYTSEFCQRYDREGRYTRPYSFVVSWCHGWSMSEGFDYDEDYDHHLDEKGWRIGGYQGNCTHTVDDIKRWCENWLAQRYLASYYNTLAELEKKKARAKWFEDHGFCLEEKEA